MADLAQLGTRMAEAKPPSGQLRSRNGAGLRGDIEVPGDKSISHRALILGALAQGETKISGLLESSDVMATLEAVRAFGADARRESAGAWRINGGPWRTPETIIDCGNSGTAARLLMGAAAGFPLRAVFTGDESLRSRPMQRVVEPLRQMGAAANGSFCLPITIQGGHLRGIRLASSIVSAQVKSAILLAGLQTDQPVEVVELAASRDHTEQMLKSFGCDVEIVTKRPGQRVRLGPRRRLSGTDLAIPGDPSSAAFPIVAALITKDSEVTVRNILDSPTRNGLFTTLREMGANIEVVDRRTVGGFAVMDMTARSSRLTGVRVPERRVQSMIDEYPALAVAAACASGETVMEGLGELRVKESDRLNAIRTGLANCKVPAEIQGHALRVTGSGRSPAGGAFVPSHGDHRIAMAFLILGLAAEKEIRVDRSEMIATSFPGFTDLMRSLGAQIAPC